MKKDIAPLFCFVGDFVTGIEKEIKSQSLGSCSKRRKSTCVSELRESEIITLILMFQDSPCRNFKCFYQSYLQLYQGEFPKMPRYEHSVNLIPRVLGLLSLLLYVLFSPGKRRGSIEIFHPWPCANRTVCAEIKSSKGLPAV